MRTRNEECDESGHGVAVKAAPKFYPDWDKAANDAVDVLRASAGRDPYDRCLSTSSTNSPPSSRTGSTSSPTPGDTA